MPGYDLEIKKSVGGGFGAVGARFQNTNSAGEGFLSAANDVNEFCAVENYGSAFSTVSLRRKSSITASNLNGFSFQIYNDASTANLSFVTTTSLVERFRLFGSTGNVLIQNGGTFTDGGQRLQVIGSMRVGTTAASAMYWDDTNNRDRKSVV